jgi:hypothetical protein
MKSRNSERKTFIVKDSYRKLKFIATFNKDIMRNSWSWKGRIDFDSGEFSFASRGGSQTEQGAKDQMFQFAHRCIDNRLGAM